MTLTQLNPTIPLRSDKASGECIAVIDYSIEHDLMWVVIDDATGQIWTVPNKDVRAYANYSAGRNLKPEPDDTPENQAPPPNKAVPAYAEKWIEAFAEQYLAQPGATQRLLNTCLTPLHVFVVFEMIADNKGKQISELTPHWMPDFIGEAKP